MRETAHWLVYDVRIEGVSFVTTYRNSFAEEIGAKRVQGLIDTLEQKNALNTAENGYSSRVQTC